MHHEFTFYFLNDTGKKKAKEIADVFNSCLTILKTICPESREFSLTKTKLEEACFFAKKAMAKEPVNHTKLKEEDKKDGS